MRIILSASPNTKAVPFNYQANLVGAFHKWLGENHEHDNVSLYSFSWLLGGKANKEGLNFREGAKWIISSFSNDLIKKVIKGIQEDPEINYGMMVKELTIQEDPAFSSNEYFRLLSPIFIKRNIDGKGKYFYYNDKEASTLLTETLQTKLRAAGLDHKDVSVSFDTDYLHPKTKMIDYRGIKCKANFCPVIIEGTPEQITFAWNVGIGNSTGIGFGALN